MHYRKFIRTQEDGDGLEYFHAQCSCSESQENGIWNLHFTLQVHVESGLLMICPNRGILKTRNLELAAIDGDWQKLREAHAAMIDTNIAPSDDKVRYGGRFVSIQLSDLVHSEESLKQMRRAWIFVSVRNVERLAAQEAENF